MAAIVEILLVEDNLGDVRLTREVLKSERHGNNLHVVRDGVEAMSYLRRQGEFAKAARPDLILLDLNLPRKDGRELLSEIKSDDELKHIPIVVLTTSKAEEDVLMAYRLHANCYIVKPLDFHRFSTVLKAVEYYWLHIARLPANDNRNHQRPDH